MTMPEGEDREVHIASLVVQHRQEAAAALGAAIAGCAALDLAVAGEFRSIVLCESDDQYALIDHIEALRAVTGVLNVSLVYHHAEPRAALDAPMPETVPTGAD
ncbi:chaperone NapD [Pseudoxanthomonas wuyuanensis]